MLFKIAKFALLLFLVLIVLLIGAAIFLLKSPQSALGLVESASGYKVSAAELNIDTEGSALSADGLLVLAPDGNELLRADEFRASVDPKAAWQGSSPFWDIRASNVHLYVTAAEEPAAPSSEAAAALDFAPILKVKSIDIDSLTVHSGNSETEYSLVAGRTGEQALALQLGMDDALSVQGSLAYQLGSRTELELSIPELDLRSLLKSDSETAGEAEESAPESGIDWAWLGMLRDTDIALVLGRVLLPEQVAESLDLKVAFAANGFEMDASVGSLQIEGETELGLNNIELDAALSTLGVYTKGKDLKGKVSFVGEGFRLAAEGEFNVNGANENSLSLDGMLNQDSSIAALVPASAAAYLPLSVVTDLKIVESHYELSGLQTTLGESDLSGELKFSLANGEPDVYARLHSKKLVVAKDDSPVESEAAADKNPQDKTNIAADTEASASDNSKVFSTDAIDWAWLEQGRFDIEVAADSLQIYAADFSEFALKFLGEQGKAQLEPFAAKFGGGGFSGSALVERVENGANSKLLFEMSGVDLEAFGLVPQEQLAGGTTRVDLDLESTGNSVAELASASNGKVHLLVHDAVVQNDSFELIGSDLILETLNKLNPFAKSDPTTRLHCALVHFDIKDGQMNTDKALVAETEKMEIIGDGDIDLNAETLDILITPNAKQTVGLNVGSVVKFMKLGGTLANPSPAVDAGGLLKSGASIGAAISTGGASLLAENLLKKAGQENACRAALKAAAGSAAAK